MHADRFFSGWLMQHKKLLIEVILPSTVLIVFFFLMIKDYIVFSASTLLEMVLLPYVIVIRKSEGKSLRYAFVVFFFLVLTWFSGLTTLIYIAFISALLFLIENNIGKTGILCFVYLIIISPIFTYIGNFVGIPARLELTEIAGSMLNLIHIHNNVAGNLIIIDTNEFSVEPACMGLNMLSISFMLAIVTAAHYEKQFNKGIHIFSVMLYLIIVFVLNLIENLIRILLLILFRIPAESIMHDVIGILCLIIYVLIPLWYISKTFYLKFTLETSEEKKKPTFKTPGIILNISVPLVFIIVVYIVKEREYNNTSEPAFCSIYGYKKSMTTNGVIKFENKQALIYVKPVKSFYGTEDTPMICWVGSGYSFVQVKRTVFQAKEIFTGKLIKGKEIIYCSWWFDNGTDKTIRQLDWRLKVMGGADAYSLINVNAAEEKMMLVITSDLLAKNIFKAN